MGDRASILQQFRAEIAARHGPRSGSGAWFRAVSGEIYKPTKNPMRPRCIVCDGGCRAGSLLDGVAGVTLQVVVYLELNEDLGVAGAMEKWQDRVETMIDEFHDWRPDGVQAESVNFVEDEPPDAALDDGAAYFQWPITFDVTYYRNAAGQGDA